MIPVGSSVQSNKIFSSTSVQPGAVQHTAQVPQSPCSSLKSNRRQQRSAKAGLTRAVATTEAPARPSLDRNNQFVREGSYESPLVQHQVGLQSDPCFTVVAVLPHLLTNQPDTERNKPRISTSGLVTEEVLLIAGGKRGRGAALDCTLPPPLQSR
jgi:hypothetical protein